MNAPASSMDAPINALAALQTHAYAYPLLEVVHILGIALLLGNLVLLELRVWGLAPELPVKPLAQATLWLVVCGFLLVAASGLLMFASQPLELIANRAFLLKVCLLMLAAANAAWFHSRGSLVKLDRLAKVQTLLSACIWVAVVACGRWIAYL